MPVSKRPSRSISCIACRSRSIQRTAVRRSAVPCAVCWPITRLPVPRFPGEIVQIAGQHRPPERPVVGPVLPHESTRFGMPAAPSTLAACQDSPMSSLRPLAAGEDDEPLRKHVEVAAAELRNDVERRRRRCSPSRPGRRRTAAGRTCRSCRSRPGTRRGAGTRTPSALNAPIDAPAVMISMSSDRQSSRIAGTTSWRMNSNHWRWIHGWPAGVAFAGEHRPAVDAVERVELDAAGVDQLAAHAPTRWKRSISSASPPAVGKRRTGRAVVAPADDVDVALDALASTSATRASTPSSCSRRPPRPCRRASAGSLPEEVGELVDLVRREQRGDLLRARRRGASSSPKKSRATSSRWARCVAQNSSNSSASKRSRAIAA